MVNGDFDKLVNAQNVQFWYSVSNDPPILTDEWITIFNVEIIDESVFDRRNPRGGPVDTPTFSMVEIMCDAILDEDTYSDWKGFRVLTTRGALPQVFYNVEAQAPLASGADDFSDNGTFTVRRMHTKAAEQGRYEVSLIIRVVPGTRNA